MNKYIMKYLIYDISKNMIDERTSVYLKHSKYTLYIMSKSLI